MGLDWVCVGDGQTAVCLQLPGEVQCGSSRAQLLVPYLLLPEATETVPGDSNCKHLHTLWEPTYLAGEGPGPETAKPEITRDETSLQAGAFVSVNVGRKRLCVMLEK